MSQHDYNIANGGGAAVRSDINSALGAIQSLNSGATAPTTTVAGMLWYDTLTGSLKQRNSGNTAWVSAAELLAGGGQLAGLRNRIINGKMDVAQRGTSFAAIGNGVYSLDRWRLGWIASAVLTVSQQADAPSTNEFVNSLRIAVTTADASIAAGDYGICTQFVEGYNARDMIGKSFTLSFWVRSSKTGVHCVSFQNTGLDRSHVSEYTVNAANTWEQKSIAVSGGLITAGTWDWTSGRGLQINWGLAAGSTFQTTANAWQTGNFLATANQVNCLDTIGNIFAITGVQLEVGAVATPFEHRPIGMELALCQRYYAKSYSQGTAPGTATVLNSCYIQRTSITGSDGFGVRFPVTMRTTPTSVAVYSTNTGASGNIYDSSGAVDVAATVNNVGDAGFAVGWSATLQRPYLFQYTTTAEL